MFLHIIEAKYIHDYVLRIRLNDGTEGHVDFKNDLHGGIFEPLNDIEIFKRFHVDPEIETIVWENGADFAPEYLHERLQIIA